MEKHGFVYIWYDRKHKRFYIGCHWGTEDDGYICSSSWMKQGYKHRNSDFKRRILSRIYTNKKDLLEEEYRWLSKIKKQKLGKRYYNKHNRHFNHWSTDENSRLSVGEKISKSKKGKTFTHSEETKEKIRKNRYDVTGKTWQLSEDTKRKMSKSHKGKKFTSEHRKKLSESHKGKENPRKGVIVKPDSVNYSTIYMRNYNKGSK